jgi:predicted nucleotidyltransferase
MSGSPADAFRESGMVNVTDEMLRQMVEAIVLAANPRRIVLFGSRARGNSGASSDVDLLIVEDGPFGPGRSRWDETRKVRRALQGFRVPKDILVFSGEEVERWRDSRNHVLAWGLREGRLLYERS